MFEATLTNFLLAFTALFSIVNPLGGALIYSQVTATHTRTERVGLAWRVALYSAVVMVVALLAGAPVLGFFGITLGALRIAGGLVVAVHAWELLAMPEHRETRKQQQVVPTDSSSDIAFFPLTLPFTTGPGTISVAVALSASGPASGADLASFYVGSTLAALSIALVVGICYASADRVVALIGQANSRVIARLAAFILLCVGVQILLAGVQDAFAPLMSARR